MPKREARREWNEIESCFLFVCFRVNLNSQTWWKRILKIWQKKKRKRRNKWIQRRTVRLFNSLLFLFFWRCFFHRSRFFFPYFTKIEWIGRMKQQKKDTKHRTLNESEMFEKLPKNGNRRLRKKQTNWMSSNNIETTLFRTYFCITSFVSLWRDKH